MVLYRRSNIIREITLGQLKEKNQDEYILVDIRDEGSILYGKIPGAINIPISMFERDLESSIKKLDEELEGLQSDMCQGFLTYHFGALLLLCEYLINFYLLLVSLSF